METINSSSNSSFESSVKVVDREDCLAIWKRNYREKWQVIGDGGNKKGLLIQRKGKKKSGLPKDYLTPSR